MSSRRSFNCISWVFLALTLATLALTAWWLMDTESVPDPLRVPTEIIIPTLQVQVFPSLTQTPRPSQTPFPTDTQTASPTWTPTNTQTPSNTPTEPPTYTPTITLTITPSSTPTITPSATPSATFTSTFTPSPSPTITFTPSPTGPTTTPSPSPAPFAFVIGDISIRADLGDRCDFQYIAGNVFDLLKEPALGLTVSVTGPGLPAGGATASSGSNVNYAASGWEVKVSSFLNTNTYTVQLLDTSGTPLSQAFEVRFTGTCSNNLVLVRFDQIKPY